MWNDKARQLLPVSMHMNHVSNSMILSKDYISLLSALRICVKVRKIAMLLECCFKLFMKIRSCEQFWNSFSEEGGGGGGEE